MSETGTFNYIHYLRLGIITGNQARWLLANFELQSHDNHDQDEYDRSLKTQMELATQVINAGLRSGDLNSVVTDWEDDDYGRRYFHLNLTKIEIEVFCAWASDLKYNLPEIFKNLISSHERKDFITLKEPESSESPSSPTLPIIRNKGGRHKGALTKTVEHVFDKLIEQKRLGLLKKSKIRSFVVLMKEMATKNNRYADDFVMGHIKSILVPEEGACKIVMQDDVKLSGQDEVIVRGRTHTINDVSKILVRLRKNNQIAA